MRRLLLPVLLALSIGHDPAPAQSPVAAASAADRVEAGREAIASRRYLEAVRHLTAAAAANPARGEVFYLLGVAYWADDRAMSISADKAAAAFTRAVVADSSAQTAWRRQALEQLAVASVRSEKLERARAAYERLLRIDATPDLRARYQTQIEEIELDQGNYQPRESTQFGPTGEIIGPVGPLKMRTNRWFEKGRHTQDPVKAEE